MAPIGEDALLDAHAPPAPPQSYAQLLEQIRYQAGCALEELTASRDALYAQLCARDNVLGQHYLRNYPMRAAPQTWAKSVRRVASVQVGVSKATVEVQCCLPVTAAEVQCSLPVPAGAAEVAVSPDPQPDVVS
jgi:hypothetical protein